MLEGAGEEEEVQTRTTARGMMGTRSNNSKRRNGFF